MERLPSHLNPSQFASLKELYAHITRERGSLLQLSSKDFVLPRVGSASDQFAAYLHMRQHGARGQDCYPATEFAALSVALLGAVKAGLR